MTARQAKIAAISLAVAYLKMPHAEDQKTEKACADLADELRRKQKALQDTEIRAAKKKAKATIK